MCYEPAIAIVSLQNRFHQIRGCGSDEILPRLILVAIRIVANTLDHNARDLVQNTSAFHHKGNKVMRSSNPIPFLPDFITVFAEPTRPMNISDS